MSLRDLVLSLVTLQFGFIVAVVVMMIRVRERVTKIEEWVRLIEKHLEDTRPK